MPKASGLRNASLFSNVPKAANVSGGLIHNFLFKLKTSSLG